MSVGFPFLFPVVMMNLTQDICNSFSAHAGEYEKAAVVQTEIGTRLFERLDYLKMTPEYVLDLGCGTGVFTKLLKKRYPKAQIFAIDLSKDMLIQSKKKHSLLKKWPLIAADMQALPFKSGQFDLIFANQVIHWANTLPDVIRELNRVMRANGCLMFTTLGPDTFKELKNAWSNADTYPHTNTFWDMHDIGDSLMTEHFLEPVVDMEMLTVHYSSLRTLLTSLKAQGVKNINTAKRKGLMGRNTWSAFLQAYEAYATSENKYPLSYEVIYGHAWKGLPRNTTNGTETYIPVSQLIRGRK
jgi:malonyl-CoA O-methyltransferase